MDLPYAEDMNYWKTSRSDAGSWLSKAEDQITKHGGAVTMQAKGSANSAAAYLIEFCFDADRFRAIWPVLPSRGGDVRAAERQAATMLFHDTKTRCLKIAIFGPRNAFFEFTLLPDGRTVGQLATPDIGRTFGLMAASDNRLLGEVTSGQ